MEWDTTLTTAAMAMRMRSGPRAKAGPGWGHNLQVLAGHRGCARRIQDGGLRRAQAQFPHRLRQPWIRGRHQLPHREGAREELRTFYLCPEPECEMRELASCAPMESFKKKTRGGSSSASNQTEPQDTIGVIVGISVIAYVRLHASQTSTTKRVIALKDLRWIPLSNYICGILFELLLIAIDICCSASFLHGYFIIIWSGRGKRSWRSNKATGKDRAYS